MNVARRFDGLLSAQQTIKLLSLLGQNRSSRSKEQTIRDLTASHPAAWSKARGTISLLCDWGVLRDDSDGLSFHGLRGMQENWYEQLGNLVVDHLVKRLSTGESIGCLQAGGVNGGLWLDSMLLPGSAEGLPLWIVEFSVAAREQINSRFWRVAHRYEPLFLEAARRVNRRRPQRPMSADQLQARLQEDAANGLMAEEWVLDFEKKRLASHPLVDQIRRVSDEDVSAGYDIVSFSSLSAIHHDLFIEVKSYVGERRFFWSRNEIDAAEQIGENYSLYLVDRSKIGESAYEPHTIPGPHSALFESQASGWSISPTNFECVAEKL